jgi:hypothetical protein
LGFFWKFNPFYPLTNELSFVPAWLYSLKLRPIHPHVIFPPSTATATINKSSQL